MLNRYLLYLFIATSSISCLSAYDQDLQEFKDFQAYKEYQKTKEKKDCLERERREQKEKRCYEEQGRNSYEEYLEFIEYRRDLEQENRYCKELEQARLCEVAQIDPNKDRLEKFRFSADWLYFKAVQDALPFTVNVPSSINVETNSFFAGSLSEPKWKYSSGVRVACAIPTGLENWEIGASWSYVSNKASNSKTSTNNHLFTIRSSAALSGRGDLYVDNAQENWKLNFNIVDLTLESPFYLNNSVKIRPIIGVLGASIDQKNTITYSQFAGKVVPINAAGANPPGNLKGKNNTRGVGPKFGIGITMSMPHQCNFNFLASFASLFGKGKSSMNYSNFRKITSVNSADNLTVISQTETGPLPVPDNKISYDVKRMFSMIQVQGAIEKVWDFDCATFGIVVGWETQNWLRQQRIITYGNVSDPSIGADLTLQGPFVRMNLEF